MSRFSRIHYYTITFLVLLSSIAFSAGISVDAGLTPAEDRWIFRSQVRYMQRDNNGSVMAGKMESTMLMTVLAYGIKWNWTVMVKQGLRQRDMSMGAISNKNSGLTDFALMSKYGLYRRNTRDYTFGAAATCAVEFPTGADVFTSNTGDVTPGFYLSWRSGRWASDISTTFTWNGFADAGNGDMNPGNELSLDWALARQFVFGERSTISLAPVLEVSYRHISPDQIQNQDTANSGESFILLSPGLKLTLSSFVVEMLVQIPVQQNQNGNQLEMAGSGLVGIRYMF